MSSEVESVSAQESIQVSSYTMAVDKNGELQQPAGQLRDCCKETVRLYAAHNPMILCQECNHLIKCFTDQEHFENYLCFCSSRNREVLVSAYEDYKVVVFRNIENFR
ncbi:MAG: hypothetical protein OXT67_00410 [Zetaproteobacteria bacterium]|nr:hypothetical protein [Zetaproteobacteria bacterium]